MAHDSYFTLPSEFSTSIQTVGTATMFYDAVVVAGRKDFFDLTTACTVFAPVDAGIKAGKEEAAGAPGRFKTDKRNSNKETKGSDEETKGSDEKTKGSNGDDKGGDGGKKGGNKETKDGNKETKSSDEENKGSNKKIIPDEYIICGFLGYSPQLLPGRSYYTVAGTEIKITWGDDGLKRVNGIPFVQSDIITKNGVLHLIKSVCFSPPVHAMQCDVTNWCAAIVILCLGEENWLGRDRGGIRLFPLFFYSFDAS